MKTIKQLLLNNHNLLGIVDEGNIDNAGYWKMLSGSIFTVENDDSLFGIFNRAGNSVILVKIEQDQFGVIDVNDLSVVSFNTSGSEPIKVDESGEVVH